MEVGGIENGDFHNSLNCLKLRRNLLNPRNFQFLFGFIYFWKIRVFLLQVGTNLAQIFLEVK